MHDAEADRDPGRTAPCALGAPLDVVGRCHALGLCPDTPRRLEALGPEGSLAEYADVVGTDPVLAARLVGVANTAYLAGAHPVLTVEGAVRRVGMRLTNELAWALALHPIGGEHPLGRALIDHGRRVAVATRSLACAVPGFPTGQAFVVGLLHDIGAQILLTLEPLVYGEFLGELGIDAPRLPLRERAAFGLDHAMAADRCLEAWGLPESLRRAIAVHHDVRSPGSDWLRSSTVELPALVALGEHLVRMHAHGFPPETLVVALVRDPANRWVGLTEAVIRAALAGFGESLARLEAVLDAASAAERRAS
jgi:HD-like signal output (HDOD) protein